MGTALHAQHSWVHLRSATGSVEQSMLPLLLPQGLFVQVLSCTTLATSVFTAYALLALVEAHCPRRPLPRLLRAPTLPWSLLTMEDSAQ